MYETYLRLYLSHDYLRAAGVPMDEAIPCLVVGVAVPVGDSASACIVHWYEETARKVDS